MSLSSHEIHYLSYVVIGLHEMDLSNGTVDNFELIFSVQAATRTRVVSLLYTGCPTI